MNGLSPQVQTFLRAAGWSPTRQVDISEDVRLLGERGYSAGPAAEEFLRQFSGLHVEGMDGFSADLSPKAALAWLPDGDRKYIELLMGEHACPVGYGSSLLMLIGTSGHTVLLKDDWLGYVDCESPGEALERLLIRKKDVLERWRTLGDAQQPP